jgi:DNA-binding SARP family transcriptional activator
MTTNKEPIPKWLVESRFDWHMVCNLLDAGKYGQAARLLHQAQITSEQFDNEILVDMLAVAYQICLACGHCAAETVWHLQASEKTRQREQELRQTFNMILEMIGRYATLDTDLKPLVDSKARLQLKDDLSQFEEHHSLWQRILSVIGRGIAPQSVEQTKAEILFDGPDREFQIPISSGVESDEQKEEDFSSLARLSVYCLGPFRVYNNDRLIKKWPGQKCKSVFKYMIINREQSIHQEILMDLFWADVAPQTARRSLYQAIYSLRQVLQTDGADVPYILCEDNCYRLNPELELWIDSEAFIDQYQTGQKLEHLGHQAEAVAAYEAAESLYDGEFLIEDLYEDWLLVHRENLKHAYLDILEQLSRYYFERQQWATCITFCQKILARDDCREDAHRRIMRCYMHQGQRHLALRQYYLCAETLERELDVPPMPATLKLFQKIQQSLVQFSSSPKLKRR